MIPSEALAARAAVWVADRLWTAWSERGAAHFAVSGGTTPAAMFVALAHLELPWSDLHVWQVDERVAPDGDADRNAGQLGPLRDAGANVHLMPVTDPDLESAAIAYDGDLHVACRGVLDVVHLGLGDDGHTASWAPGDPVIAVESADVAVTQAYKGRVRLTLTRPAVNRARAVAFLVAGAGKANALSRLLTDDPGIPATAVRRDHAVCFTDPAAAARP